MPVGATVTFSQDDDGALVLDQHGGIVGTITSEDSRGNAIVCGAIDGSEFVCGLPMSVLRSSGAVTVQVEKEGSTVDNEDQGEGQPV